MVSSASITKRIGHKSHVCLFFCLKGDEDPCYVSVWLLQTSSIPNSQTLSKDLDDNDLLVIFLFSLSSKDNTPNNMVSSAPVTKVTPALLLYLTVVYILAFCLKCTTKR